MNVVAGALLLALSLGCALVSLVFAKNLGQPARRAIEYYLRSAAGSRVSRRSTAAGLSRDAALQSGERVIRVAFTLAFALFSVALLVAATVDLS
jgi:hypothetical protein